MTRTTKANYKIIIISIIFIVVMLTVGLFFGHPYVPVTGLDAGYKYLCKGISIDLVKIKIDDGMNIQYGTESSFNKHLCIGAVSTKSIYTIWDSFELPLPPK